MRGNAMARSTALLLLRGPLLVTAVVVALFYPTLIQISIGTWVRLSILGVGLALSLLDVFALVKERVRATVKRHASSIVLDDVLRAIFDKEGLIALVTSTMVGNATLYNFGNPDQRVRLVGSCLETDEDEARTILTAPGGVVKILPESVQNWLEQSSFGSTESNSDSVDEPSECLITEQVPEHVKEPLRVDEACYSSESDAEPEPCRNNNSTDSTEETTRINSSCSYTQRAAPVQTPAPPKTHPQSPEQVVASVVKEIVLDKIKALSQSIPEQTLQAIGLLASAALAVQLRASPRTRQVVMGVLQGTTAMSLAGVVIGALTALVGKRTLFETERIIGGGNRTNRGEEVLPAPLKSLWKAIRSNQLLGGRLREWQGALALFILFFVGKLRKRLLVRQGHYS